MVERSDTGSPRVLSRGRLLWAAVLLLVLAGAPFAVWFALTKSGPMVAVPDVGDRVYDHFLFVRRDHRMVDYPQQQYILMLATVHEDGFVLKDIYRPTGETALFPDELFCVRRGKLYATEFRSLVAIDLESGERKKPKGFGSEYYYDAGMLYSWSVNGDFKVRDLDRDTERRLFKLEGSSCFAVSPDHRRMVFFHPKPVGYVPTIVNFETQAVLRAAEEIRYEGSPPFLNTGGGVITAPPFKWIDDETVLFVRTHIPPENLFPDGGGIINEKNVNYFTLMDAKSGQFDDIAEQHGMTFSADGGPRELARVRVDRAARKVEHLDTSVGVFRLIDGEEEFANVTFEGESITGGEFVVSAVSPDGKRVIWRADIGDNQHGAYEVRYFDSEQRLVRTVSSGWATEPFLWVSDSDL